MKGIEHKIQTITAAKIEELSAVPKTMQFIIKDKAVILTIIPKQLYANPASASLNGEDVDFSIFHQNNTHSWVRIDPHEKGLVKINDYEIKEEHGGGCLIATAAFGTELSPQVQFLREIRENKLQQSNYGSSFLNGFNEIYYSFSPSVADYQREHPVFKDAVKIGITPMLMSLSLMTVADSENEILGIGIGIILLNVGMYLAFPIIICYYGMKYIRTRSKNKSNLSPISRYTVHISLKNSLFGIIALLVLTVSLPSAFAQTADSESPIQMVLDLTKTNLEDSFESTGDVPSTAQTFYEMGQEEYDKAIDALNNGDMEAAEEYAIIAMALFEDSASVIGELEESLVLDQLPPGFGQAIDDPTDSQGQGLGVGDIPPGIMNQLVSENIFDISEEISEIEDEVDGLQELVNSNENLDVDFEQYEESLNLAKQVLANGDIPDAQAKLALANELKDDLYEQINEAVQENQDERVQEFAEQQIEEIEDILEKGENLGLTQKAINELQDTLDVLNSGDVDDILEKTDEDSEFAKEVEENDVEQEFDGPGNSENAPGQNDEGGPGNSENAPGQNDEGGPGNSENAPGQNDEGGPGNSENAPGQNDEGGPGNSENAPGQNDEGGPGNSENAPGQNDEGGPGNSENAPGQNDNELDLPPGIANQVSENGVTELDDSFEGLPPGIVKNLVDAGITEIPEEFLDLPPGQILQMMEIDVEEIEESFDETVEDNGVEESTDVFGALPPGIANQLFDQGITEVDDSFDDLPPGIAKQLLEMGVTEIDDSFEGMPPGQILASFQDSFTEYSPDEYFDDAVDDVSEDTFEDQYDELNKKGKAKDKKDKDEKDAEETAKAKGNDDGGNPNCDNEGIYGLDDLSNSGNTGVDYTVSGLTAVGSNCKDSTSNIKITIDGPNSPPAKHNNESQPFTFQPDEVGTWTIEIKATGQFASKTITVTTVGNAPNANAGNDQTVTEGNLVTLDGSGSTDSDGTIVSYSWERTNNGGPDPTLSDSTAQQPTFTAPDPPGSSNDYEYTLTVEDNDGNTDTDVVVITVNESGGGGGGGGNSPPTIDTISNNFSVNEGTTGHSLTATASDPDVGDTLTYAWTYSGNGPITVTMYNADTLNPTFDVSTFNGNNSRDITFTLTVTDDGTPVEDVTDTVVVTVNHT